MVLALSMGILLMLVGAGAVWGLTAAAADGRLKRNPFAGIRTAATGASDAAWVAGHRAALPTARSIGLMSLVFGAAMMIDGIVTRDEEGSVLFWIMFVLGYGGIFVGTIMAAVRAGRAARAA